MPFFDPAQERTRATNFNGTSRVSRLVLFNSGRFPADFQSGSAFGRHRPRLNCDVDDGAEPDVQGGPRATEPAPYAGAGGFRSPTPPVPSPCVGITLWYHVSRRGRHPGAVRVVRASGIAPRPHNRPPCDLHPRRGETTTTKCARVLFLWSREPREDRKGAFSFHSCYIHNDAEGHVSIGAAARQERAHAAA